MAEPKPLSPEVTQLLDDLEPLARRAAELICKDQEAHINDPRTLDHPLASVGMAIIDIMALASRGNFKSMYIKAMMDVATIPLIEVDKLPKIDKSINPFHS